MEISPDISIVADGASAMLTSSEDATGLSDISIGSSMSTVVAGAGIFMYGDVLRDDLRKLPNRDSPWAR